MIRINLLPVKAARKRYGGLLQLILLGVVLLFTVVVLWAPVPIWKNRAGMEARIDATQRELEQTKAEIERLERIIGQVNQFTEKKKSLEQTKAIIESLKAGKTGPVRLLDELAVRTPKKVWITKLEESRGTKTITIAGEAVGYEDVSAFMAELEQSPFFSQISLIKSDARRNKNRELKWVGFTIEARAKYKI